MIKDTQEIKNLKELVYNNAALAAKTAVEFSKL